MQTNSPIDLPPVAKAYIMNNQPTSEILVFVAKLKNGIWLLGIASWLFGITDRSIASFSDDYLSAIEIMQLFTASFFFLGWLYLKPSTSFSTEGIND